MLTLSHTSLVFTCLQCKSFENTEEKGEIAGYEHFLLSPQCFLPVWRTFIRFELSSANSLSLEESNTCYLVKS